MELRARCQARCRTKFVQIPPMGVTPLRGKFFTLALPKVISINPRRSTCIASASQASNVA